MGKTVWLIETANQTWWDGRSLESFTDNADDAVRFARFEDAERIKYWLLADKAFAVRSVEHMWFDAAPQSAGEGTEGV